MHASALEGAKVDRDRSLEAQRCTMGDKSPKSKDKRSKQDAAQKNQKRTAAAAKATPVPVKPSKQGR
jgi:hypothetical protein